MQEHAEYLRLLLAMGLVTRAEIIAWADSQIEAMEEPPIQLIDVALGGNLIVEDLMKLLEILRGDSDTVQVAHRVLGELRNRFRTGQITLDELSFYLSRYSQWAVILEIERFHATSVVDRVRYFVPDFYDTLESVYERIERFFTQYAADPLP